MFPYTIWCLHMKLYGILKSYTAFAVHYESPKESVENRASVYLHLWFESWEMLVCTVTLSRLRSNEPGYCATRTWTENTPWWKLGCPSSRTTSHRTGRVVWEPRSWLIHWPWPCVLLTKSFSLFKCLNQVEKEEDQQLAKAWVFISCPVSHRTNVSV